MEFLHDELAKFKAAVGNAFNFADPSAYIADKEAEFKGAIADAVHRIEDRVDAVEQVVHALTVAVAQPPSPDAAAVQPPQEPPAAPAQPQQA